MVVNNIYYDDIIPEMNSPEDELCAVERNVAKTLSRLRKENGLTLRELSERSGLSESFLSKVENRKTAITISSLNRLAEVFALPIGVFFESPDENSKLVILGPESGKVVRLRGRHGINIRMLAHEYKERLMEPFLVDVNSAKSDMPTQSHEGQEFIFVQNGRCRFHYGHEIHEISQGMSLYFDSGVGHKVEAISGEKCVLVSVVTSKDYSFHKNITRLLNA